MARQGYPSAGTRFGAHPTVGAATYGDHPTIGATYGAHPDGTTTPVTYPTTAGLVLSLDTWSGNDTTHLSVTSSKITQFVNQVGGAAWAQATSTSQYAWESDSLASSMNGFPSGHPDGGDFYLGTEAALVAINATNQAYTAYFVVSADVATTLQCYFSWGNSGVATGYRGFGYDASGVLIAIGNDGTSKNVLGTTPLTSKRPYVFCFRGTGTTVAAWINGAVEFAATAQNLGNVSTDRASWGSRARSTNDIKHVGQCGEVRVYTGAHSDVDVAGNSAYLVEKWQLTYSMFIAAGDSISRGFSSVSGLRLEERLSPTLPAQRYSAATNGWTTANLDATKATLVSPRTDARSWAAARNVVNLWIGTNDITTTSDSAATIYARTSALVTYYKAHSAKVIICTCLRRTTAQLSGDGITPFNTIQAAYNALILANAAGADTVLDVSTTLDSAGYNPDGNPNTYSSDGTHLTDAAYAVLMPGFNAAYNALV